MTFARSLVVGFGAPVLLAVVITGAALVGVRALVAAEDEVVASDVRIARDAGGLRFLAERKVAVSRGYLLSGDPSRIADMGRADKAFADGFASVRAGIRDGEGLTLANRVAVAKDAFDDARDDLSAQRQRGVSPEDLVASFDRTLSPARARLDEAVHALLDHREARLAAAVDRFRGTRLTIEWLLVGVAAAAIVLVVVLALVASRVLSRLYRASEAAVRQRDEFLSAAAHDVKTPIAALSLRIERAGRRLAARKGDGWDAKEEIEALGRLTRRALHTMDELLDGTRLSAGRLDLRRSQVDLGEVVTDVVSALEEQAEAAGVRISVVVSVATGPVVGSWDRARLEQVLSNLLTNAMKFGPGRPIEVEVSRAGRCAVVRVTDHGLGIPTSEVPFVFERFVRASTGRRFSGDGLGLWISEQLVHAHGGTISVDSREGKGTTFRVELPVSVTAPAEVEDAAAARRMGEA